MWEYVHYMMLIALRSIRVPSVLYTARGVVAAAAVMWLSRVGQDYAATAGLCLSVVLLTAVSYPWLIHRFFAVGMAAGGAAIPRRPLYEPCACPD